MALFSTLLSASNEQSTATSPDTPTLIQLFNKKSITYDENAKLQSHAVLSYQALEVSSPEVESKLFGQRRRANQTLNPNLGVWNCCVIREKLVDSLLMIPDSVKHYCMTIDLSDPSMVEPAVSVLHDALVRLLVRQSPESNDNGETTTRTTSLAKLKTTQFGLAPEEKQPSTPPYKEDDDHIKISLLICALVAPTNKDDYKETQSQNLVFYHLRRYAAALNCTLCFVGKVPIAEEVPILPLEQVSYCWREWILNNQSNGGMKSFITPDNHQPDLIESVLLRNAECDGEWKAAYDSLWKALPSLSIGDTGEKDLKRSGQAGDEDWLSQLRDSVGSELTTPSPRSAAPNAPAAKEDVSSFFQDLLKK